MKLTVKLSYLIVASWALYSSFCVGKTPYRCPQTMAKCNCSSNIHDYEYSCETDEYTSVRVRIDPSDEIKITCNVDDDELWTTWLDVVSEINAIGKYTVMTVYNCTLPTTSFKRLMQSFGIESVNKLYLTYIPNGDSVFVDNYFDGMARLVGLYLQHNGILALPNDVFRGLTDLERLYLDNNDLMAVNTQLFEPIPRLKYLELGNNYINGLEANVFKHVPNLVFLNIYSNSLSDIRRAVFTGVPKLKSLDLSNNGLTKLDGNVFHDLSQLEELNLNFNNISHLPEGIFANTSSLSRLRAIQSQSSNVTALPAGLFHNLTSLTSIYMNWNNFTTLPADMFVKTYNLSSLVLKHNKLAELPGSLFDDTTKIREIDLSYNRLSWINDTLFKNLKNLQRLNLANNRLISINNVLFSSLSLLTDLYLQNNDLSSLGFDAFASLTKLKFVDLSNNKLRMKTNHFINYSYLHYCIELEEIRLRNNSITDIFDDWRLTDVKLKKLDLSYNAIEMLSLSQLQFVSSQVMVNISHNRIQNIDDIVYTEMMADLSCPRNGFCDSQTEIQLDHNPIVCDCRALHLARYFQNAMRSPAYRWLKLRADDLRCAQPTSFQDTRISKIDLKLLQCPWEDVVTNDAKRDSCPKNCACLYRPLDSTLIVNCTNSTNRGAIPKRIPSSTNVKDIELLLSNNNLTSVDGISELMESSNVTKLILSSNNLKNVDNLNVPPRLKVLELHSNQLTYLAKKTIERLNRTINLTSLTLYDNPWRCDCETKHMLNFLHARFQQIPYYNNITCAENGKPIVQLTIDDLCGLSITMIVTCVSLATFGVLFGALIALYYRFQHEIKVWMFAHKICLWLVAEKEIDRNKKYDAFVSYSHLDETFVVEQLVPQLENGDYPYRLCLHFRDWVVGDWIPDQIIKSVENSRRTIVVLSPNFLNSVWGKMEFRTAHLKAIKERCARVIIIILDDIGSTDKLDPELKAYLTMNTYVKWGDPWFWQKLKYALPHPQKYVKQHPISITKEIMNSNIRVNKLNVAPMLELAAAEKVERNEIKSCVNYA